jgi:hypothetical protein
MCAAAPRGLLTGHQKQQQLLELFSIALGRAAAEALTGAAASMSSAGASPALPAAAAEWSSSGSDLELAVSCWWRAAALQALSAYVLGVIGKGLAEDAAQQVHQTIECILPWPVDMLCCTLLPAAAA